jgi:hypothetical protein
MLQPYHAAATNTRVISAAVLLSALVDLGVPSAEAFALVPATQKTVFPAPLRTTPRVTGTTGHAVRLRAPGALKPRHWAMQVSDRAGINTIFFPRFSVRLSYS